MHMQKWRMRIWKTLQNMHTQIIEWLNELVPFIKHSLSEVFNN